jgi:hypothetical protein
MNPQGLCIGLLLGAVAATASAQPQAPTASRQRELDRLVGERNYLYARLAQLRQEQAWAGTTGASTLRQEITEEMGRVQQQADVVELRLADLASQHGLVVPGPSTPSPQPDLRQAAAVAGTVQPTTRPAAEQLVEFNKLVQDRNRLHAELTRLDRQASDLIKGGANPLSVHSQQVSLEDQLDLVELRLAILATRHGLAVPPVPGREPAPDGAAVAPDDEADRGMERPFARGRERTLKKLREDTRRFLSTLDFEAFLSG